MQELFHTVIAEQTLPGFSSAASVAICVLADYMTIFLQRSCHQLSQFCQTFNAGNVYMMYHRRFNVIVNLVCLMCTCKLI